VELISIKRYLNHCLHYGAFYYQFFACLPFNKAFINFSFIILPKNLWIENDGLELWKNWLNFPALFVLHTKFWLGFGAQNTWTLNLACSSTSSSSSSWSRFLLSFFFGFENFWSSWIYYCVSEGFRTWFLRAAAKNREGRKQETKEFFFVSVARYLLECGDQSASCDSLDFCTDYPCSIWR
jgi:hypothetical protein